MKLLYIEDTPINVRVMQRIAQHKDYQLRVASNATEGLALLQDGFDLILIDISLPDMDGLALAREIRTRLPSVPIVAVTAHALPDDKAKCLAAGCTDYVAKPFGWNTMLAFLTNYEP